MYKKKRYFKHVIKSNNIYCTSCPHLKRQWKRVWQIPEATWKMRHIKSRREWMKEALTENKCLCIAGVKYTHHTIYMNADNNKILPFAANTRSFFFSELLSHMCPLRLSWTPFYSVIYEPIKKRIATSSLSIARRPLKTLKGFFSLLYVAYCE